MCYVQQLCCISLLCLSGFTVAANVRLRAEGLSGQLEKNVRAQFSTIEGDEVTPDCRFRARVDDTIHEGLKALDYHQPTIEFDLRPPPKEGRQVLTAKITPGVPVLIGGTDVAPRDGARAGRDYLKLLDTHPAIGTVLNQGDYENFKKSSTSIALRKSYFDSEFIKAQLGIASGLYKAFWDIDYNSGGHYHFEYVTLEEPWIRDEYLQNLVPFKEGDEYKSKDLAKLNHRFSATG